MEATQHSYSFEQMMELFKETRIYFKEIDERLDKYAVESAVNRKEIEELSKETKKMSLETEKIFQETAKEIKAVTKNIGDLGNSFGKYTEGLLGPSIRRILEKEFGMKNTFSNTKGEIGNKKYEIDYLGVSNGNVNQAMIVEVKSNLKAKDIEQLKEILKIFREAFPMFANKNEVFGAFATVNCNKKLAEEVYQNGFYLFGIKDEVAHNITPKSFKAKAF